MSLRAPERSFLDADVVLDPARLQTPYAFLGIPFGPPYVPEDLCVCADAADAVRAVTHRMAYRAISQHHDFDLAGPLFPGGQPSVTDCGDVVGDVRDPDRIWDTGVGVLTSIVHRGAVPLVVGGLDAIPPIVVTAFAATETVHVLHVDAHLDFRDEVGAVARGYSSPVRRIRELPCVDQIVQVGMRSVGSARPSDITDAKAAGNRIVTAWELHERGATAVLDELPTDRRWVVTIDCDGLDPSIAPGVGWPEPGGLTYPQIRTLVASLAQSGRIAACVVTEFQPARDIAQMTALTIARLFMNIIGLQRDLAARGHGPSA
jgi:agmatinase